jgi:hypothetical protein
VGASDATNAQVHCERFGCALRLWRNRLDRTCRRSEDSACDPGFRRIPARYSACGNPNSQPHDQLTLAHRRSVAPALAAAPRQAGVAVRLRSIAANGLVAEQESVGARAGNQGAWGLLVVHPERPWEISVVWRVSRKSAELSDFDNAVSGPVTRRSANYGNELRYIAVHRHRSSAKPVNAIIRAVPTRATRA